MNSPGGIAAPGIARAGASILMISAGCTCPRRRAVTIRWAPSSSGCSGSVGSGSTCATTPRPAGLKSRNATSCSLPSPAANRTRSSTSSSPSPVDIRPILVITARASSGWKSTVGQT